MHHLPENDRTRFYESARLLSIQEAAATLNIGRTKVYDLMNSGDLKTVKLGRRRLVPIESVRGLIDRLSAA